MVLVIGDNKPRGTYIQKLKILKSIIIYYGRTNNQNKAKFPPGTYLLVGSALAEKGAGSLPMRLTRHARRSDDSKHSVFSEYVHLYHLDPKKLSKSKTLHWHSDYLLNSMDVDLCDAIIIQHPTRLEEKLAMIIEELPEVDIMVPGFASTDTNAKSHLFKVPEDEIWWNSLRKLIEREIIPVT